MHSSCNNKNYGGQSMVGDLKRVLVRRPNPALGRANSTIWHYTSQVDLIKAQSEHDYLVKILASQHVEVIYHDQVDEQFADAIFVHDPALMTNSGAIILRMGKALRQGEEALIKNKLIALNIPILAELAAPAIAEGGDLLWLDEKTLIAGKGFRTNQSGIDQLKDVLSLLSVSLLDFDLSYFQGKESCLHLQSFISLVDVKTALVYLPLMPCRLLQLLIEKNFQIIEIAEEEFLTMGSNALAIKPKLVLSLDVNRKTQQRLEQAGINVLRYSGTELSLKTEGGPTCLTRPIKRLF